MGFTTTALAVATAAFFLYQAVVYLGDVRAGKKGHLLMWRNPMVLSALVFIGLFVGVIVSLISQDSSGVVVTSGKSPSPLPLNYDWRTTQEWIRAIILGFGAMPILKKGNLVDLAKVNVDNTYISASRPTFGQYMRLWWSAQS